MNLIQLAEAGGEATTEDVLGTLFEIALVDAFQLPKIDVEIGESRDLVRSL